MNKNTIIAVFATIALLIIGTLIFNFISPGLLTTSPSPASREEAPFPEVVDESESIQLKVYFNNTEDTPDDCEAVFPVERNIPATQSVAKAAIRELLEGPTQEEADRGFITNIPKEAELIAITIENGTALVNFDGDLEAAGSCRVQAIRAQITETLLQFPTVDEVEIAIEGQTEGVLQP